MQIVARLRISVLLRVRVLVFVIGLFDCTSLSEIRKESGGNWAEWSIVVIGCWARSIC